MCPSAQVSGALHLLQAVPTARRIREWTSPTRQLDVPHPSRVTGWAWQLDAAWKFFHRRRR